MTYQQTKQRVTTLTIWLFYLSSLAATPGILLIPSQQGDLLALLVGHVLCTLVLLAHRRGVRWVRFVLLIAIAAIIGLLSPQTFVTEEFAISFFAVPTLALVLTSGGWVLGASAITYATLLLRGGYAGPYIEPTVVVLTVAIVGGMAAARFLVDAAIRRAEDQAAQLEEQAQLLTAERASLAERVEERTRELSAANAALIFAGKAKNDFLASVSHELRTPLNIILGSVELLADDIYGPLNSEQRRALDRVGVSGQHLLGLINDILDIAKMEQGSFKIERGPVVLQQLCADLLEIVAPSAERKGLRLEHTIAADLPSAMLDGRRLRQILLNLLANAIKFTPPGGVVGLHVGRDAQPGWVCLTVSDTGIGIALEQQPLLFSPFVQLDAGLARSHEGAGLGLALVEQLTRLHGGVVAVESAPGAGSRFTVRLPLAPDDADPAATPAAPPLTP